MITPCYLPLLLARKCPNFVVCWIVFYSRKFVCEVSILSSNHDHDLCRSWTKTRTTSSRTLEALPEKSTRTRNVCARRGYNTGDITPTATERRAAWVSKQKKRKTEKPPFSKLFTVPCSQPCTDGAHVRIQDKRIDDGWYIAPMCSKHNNPNNDGKMFIDSRVMLVHVSSTSACSSKSFWINLLMTMKKSGLFRKTRLFFSAWEA